jgi:hypothetical protein
MDKHEAAPTRCVDPARYRSYLVRLWREAPGEPWRCQVHCVTTRRERRFAGLAELFEFLEAEVADGEPPHKEKGARQEQPEKGSTYEP